MQIGSISSIPAIRQSSLALDASTPKPLPSTTTASASKTPAATAVAVAAAAPAASAKGGVSHGGGDAASSSSTATELITATYSTTVAGKSYSGSVQEQAGGQYTASVPNLPGATASGSSIQAAEDNLGLVISILA